MLWVKTSLHSAIVTIRRYEYEYIPAPRGKGKEYGLQKDDEGAPVLDCKDQWRTLEWYSHEDQSWIQYFSTVYTKIMKDDATKIKYPIPIKLLLIEY